jgi:hypothetical protein
LRARARKESDELLLRVWDKAKEARFARADCAALSVARDRP